MKKKNYVANVNGRQFIIEGHYINKALFIKDLKRNGYRVYPVYVVTEHQYQYLMNNTNMTREDFKNVKKMTTKYIVKVEGKKKPVKVSAISEEEVADKLTERGYKFNPLHIVTEEQYRCLQVDTECTDKDYKWVKFPNKLELFPVYDGKWRKAHKEQMQIASQICKEKIDTTSEFNTFDYTKAMELALEEMNVDTPLENNSFACQTAKERYDKYCIDSETGELLHPFKMGMCDFCPLKRGREPNCHGDLFLLLDCKEADTAQKAYKKLAKMKWYNCYK